MDRGAYIRILRAVSAFTFIVCATAQADGPWVGKMPAEWDRAEVRRILYESPWVKHFRKTTRDLEFVVPDQGPTALELRGYHAKESKKDGEETTDFYVRWVSSRTLRRANARRLALNKPDSGAGDREPPPIMDFEIAISGRDLSAFERAREATLKAKCYLATSSRPRIRPTQVEFARGSNGRIRGILFRFPRKTESGEPTISTHETKVWFFERGAEIEFNVMFHPQAMVDGMGMDL